MIISQTYKEFIKNWFRNLGIFTKKKIVIQFKTFL